MAISYKDSGVDVTRGYKAVDLMKKYVKTTYNENVLGDIGSFGGFYSISGEKMEEPVLVAGTDGVGTKLKYAFLLEKHDTIGIDAVAMCVNDIVCPFLSRLLRLRSARSGSGSGSRERHCGRLPAGEVRADRRRNGGNARLLSPGRVRPRGVCRRHRR